MAKYLKQKDDLYAGRKPSDGKGLTVAQLVTQFLAGKQQLVDNGERSPRTLNDYQRVCKQIREVFGDNWLVATLYPTDFSQLRTAFAETCGLVTLSNDVGRPRVVVKYAFDARMVDRPIAFGPTRCELSWEASDGATELLQAWLDAAGRNRVVAILDELPSEQREE